MNIFDVLYVGKTGKIKPDASLTDNLYGKKFYDAHSGIITTATGNPVSIVTNKAQNAISTILSYSPKQSGSGDPSPTNIRPITGWTEANLGVNSETPTTTISLGGTYYGFSVDVERGVLRVTWAIHIVTGNETFYELPSNRFYFALNDQYAVAKIPATGEQTRDFVKCNIYKSVMQSESTGINLSIFKNSANRYVTFRNTDYQTASDFKDYMKNLYDLGTPVVVSYELATPTELPLTPKTVALLAGNNTLWTDGDSLSVTYKAKKA